MIDQRLKSLITLSKLKDAYAKYNYSFLTDGRLNLFGVRNNDLSPGTFNDALGIHYVGTQGEILILHQGTVDPGSYYLNHPINPKGTAVIKFQQGSDAYAPGYHRGYKAIVQVKPMWVFRISKDQFIADGKKIVLTGKPCTYEQIGMNMHRAHPTVEIDDVMNFSAACQVRNVPKEWEEFIKLTWIAGKKYNYTVFSENDFA